MNQRITKISQWLKEENISFAFVNSTPNVYYLSQFYCEPHERLLGLVLLPNQEPFLICPAMETFQARQSGWKYDIVEYSDSDNVWDRIYKALQERNITSVTSIAVEKEFISYQRGLNLLHSFPNATLFSLEQKMHKLRMIKSELETEALREAARYADYGVEVGVQAIQAGKTEMEILAAIEFELKKKGIQKMSFSTIVLSGEKTALPHGKPGDRKIREGDFVLFDLGVVFKGYCSDITRTVAFQSASAKQREIYNVVLRAQHASLNMSKPGIRIGDLDIVARNMITDAGYGKYFLHRIGHGLGIDVHEYPSMSDNNNVQAEQGMVYTIEPGVYVPDVGGVRIEDDILVTAEGYESLTQFPKELLIVK